MISHSTKSYREPAVYYAEASSYLDAMDYIDFMSSDGWKPLVPPFVTQTERIAIYKIGQLEPEWLDQPAEWGFVLHRFDETSI